MHRESEGVTFAPRMTKLAVPPLVVTVDVEDWPQSTWNRSLPITDRARTNAHHVLDILREHHCTVTMFVLGKFAERFPSVVRRMARDGHEIASHGYGHVEVFRQKPTSFQQDIVRAKHLLEDITGDSVVGYRAPDFSIVDESLWALEMLVETGHCYDASIFPIRMGRYGIDQWPTEPRNVLLPNGGEIVELPVGTVPFLRRRWPAGGGGYHRLLPWPVIRAALRRGSGERAPFVMYCHPYEFDASEMRELAFDIPVRTRLHQGLGRGTFQEKFEKILKLFGSGRACDVAENHAWADYDISDAHARLGP